MPCHWIIARPFLMSCETCRFALDVSGPERDFMNKNVSFMRKETIKTKPEPLGQQKGKGTGCLEPKNSVIIYPHRDANRRPSGGNLFLMLNNNLNILSRRVLGLELANASSQSIRFGRPSALVAEEIFEKILNCNMIT